MGIRLGAIHNPPNQESKIELLDSLTIEQFNLIKSCTNEIHELNTIRNLLQLVELNDRDITEYLNSVLNDLKIKSIHWNGVQNHDLRRAFLNTNRLLLNYLSSIKTFMDHCETNFNRRFGEESSEFMEFKKILSFFYDKSFSYRFFYKLRNYSQHCGLPIHNIGVTSKKTDNGNEKIIELEVAFDKNKLLADYNSWGKLKEDFKDMPEQFDLYPQLVEMTHNIKEIERNIELLLMPTLLEAANKIIILTKAARDTGGEVFITDNIKIGKNRKIDSIQMLYLPFDLIDSICGTCC